MMVVGLSWRKGLLIAALAAAGAGLEARAEPEAAQEPRDEREFREVLDVLKERFANQEILKEKMLGKAALDGIMARLGPGAILMSEPSILSTHHKPIRTEVLPHLIGYWRMPSFKPAKGWDALEKQLSEWQKGKVLGIILDVRDFQAANDYAGAAKVASLFVPPGRTLFTVQGLQIPQEIYRSEGDPVFTKPVVVLTNRRTVGAAEALAASLREVGGAFVVGRSTAGQAARFMDNKLSSGRYLRLAVGEAVLGDGTTLFGRGVAPDIPVVVDDGEERKALAVIEERKARDVVQELQPRRRMSEAALVREENPELDEVLLQRRDGDSSDKESTFIQDIALIRSMDTLRVLDLTRTTLRIESADEGL